MTIAYAPDPGEFPVPIPSVARHFSVDNFPLPFDL